MIKGYPDGNDDLVDNLEIDLFEGPERLVVPSL
jgi:hypothetical protein